MSRERRLTITLSLTPKQAKSLLDFAYDQCLGDDRYGLGPAADQIVRVVKEALASAEPIPRAPCGLCGKLVAKTKTFGFAVRHKCPHGEDCETVDTPWRSGPHCKECRGVAERCGECTACQEAMLDAKSAPRCRRPVWKKKPEETSP